MFSSSTSAIFRFIGWSFLPSALANGAINAYYRLITPGIAPPRRGTPAYASQYRIAFAALAAMYLIYTLVAAVTSLQPNYYRVLGVDQRADEQAMKAAFRRFARRNHPDRPGIGAGGAERFREVRDAYEMLKNPVKRFAYERFGPEIISWKGCTTPKEYIIQGISASSGFPIGTAAILFLMSILGQSSSSSFVSAVYLRFHEVVEPNRVVPVAVHHPCDCPFCRNLSYSITNHPALVWRRFLYTHPPHIVLSPPVSTSHRPPSSVRFTFRVYCSTRPYSFPECPPR